MLIEKAMEGRGSNEATDKIKKLADLEKIEFDVQQDLLDTLQDMYRNEINRTRTIHRIYRRWVL